MTKDGYAKASGLRKESGRQKEKGSLGSHVRMWGRYAGESLAASLGASVVLLFFYGVLGSSFSAKSLGGGILTSLALYPYYLTLAAVFVQAIVSANAFQLYFPVLVSMNASRRSVVLGAAASQGGCTLLVACISILIWRWNPSDIAVDGIKLIPLLAGLLLFTTGFTIVLGAVSLRWGKIGTLILVLFFMFWGAGAGILYAVNGADAGRMLAQVRDIDQIVQAAVLGAGLVMFLLGTCFSAAVVRKLEIRR